jgi:hypothetical protein
VISADESDQPVALPKERRTRYVSSVSMERWDGRWLTAERRAFREGIRLQPASPGRWNLLPPRARGAVHCFIRNRSWVAAASPAAAVPAVLNMRAAATRPAAVATLRPLNMPRATQ